MGLAHKLTKIVKAGGFVTIFTLCLVVVFGLSSCKHGSKEMAKKGGKEHPGSSSKMAHKAHGKNTKKMQDTKSMAKATVLGKLGHMGKANMKASHWGYVGSHGPAHWGKMNSSFGLCQSGRQQSPIDLQWTQPLPFGGLKLNYKSSSIRMSNNGHSINVDVDPGNMVSIRGQQYELTAFHFHSLSEHTIAQKHYPMAMHLVHKNSKGEMAIVGVMFKEGEHNSSLSALWQYLSSLGPKPKKITDLKFNPRDLTPKTMTYYSYKGSLTEPPCSENVLWSVLNTSISASPQQIKAFRKFYKRNYRPTQPLHGRTIVNY